MIGQKLSEYHTGYRAFSRRVLETLPLLANSDDFVFDNQMLVQCHAWGFAIAEVSCPTKYFAEASSIGFRRSVRYGLGTLGVSLGYRLWRMGLLRPRFLTPRRRGGRSDLRRCRPPRHLRDQHRPRRRPARLSTDAHERRPKPLQP